MRDNQLSGTVPSELGQLTNLKASLLFQNNQFLTGPIPSELGLLTNLEQLLMHNNSFTQQLPSELGLMTSLNMLTLQNNSLSGTIPTELGDLHPSLYSLKLQGNPLLEGTIPQGLCTLNASWITGAIYSPCEGTDPSLTFDCTPQLCGCDCSCCEDGACLGTNASAVALRGSGGL